MTRRALSMALALAALGAIAPVAARAADDPRFAIGFVQGLRERGYYDLALDYLTELRGDKNLPADVKAKLDYEEGRTLTEAATHGSDPEVAKRQLDQARDRLEAFIKANPGKSETVEALVDLAHLLYERGRNATIEADEAKTPAEKETKLVSARGLFGSARDSYNQAYERLDSKFKNFPNFLEENDPLKAEKERVHTARMNAELQRAVVDYEEAQTYPPGSPQRTEILDKTGKTFEDIYKRYRTQMAGITAQMWQAKCFEERGDLNAAMGIYDQLLQHGDPRLRRLQKQVDYFRIIVLGKRKQYALAADEAANWLRIFPNDRELRGAGRPAGAGQGHPRAAPRPEPGRLGAGHQEVHRRPRRRRPRLLAVQGRGAGAPAEVRPEGGRQRRVDRRAEVRRRGRPGRRGDLDLGVRQGHRDPPRRAQEGHGRRADRQVEQGPVHAGVLLLHDEALLRGRRAGRAHRPPLPGGRVGGEGDGHRQRGATSTPTTRTVPTAGPATGPAISVAWKTSANMRRRPGPTPTRATSAG